MRSPYDLRSAGAIQLARACVSCKHRPRNPRFDCFNLQLREVACGCFHDGNQMTYCSGLADLKETTYANGSEYRLFSND